MLNSQLSMMTKDGPDYQDIEKEFFEVARRLRGNNKRSNYKLEPILHRTESRK
jgi:hypothetical protein